MSATTPLSVWLEQLPAKPSRLVDRIGDRVCTFNDGHPRTKEFQVLLSAAPELLGALKLAEARIRRGYSAKFSEAEVESMCPDLATIRAAIAKAEGRS
jgi:hypothetical protein